MAHAIDQQIAGGGEHEGLGAIGQRLARGRDDAGIHILPQIGGFLGVAAGALQEAHQGCLQRQDFADEPSLHLGRGHWLPRLASVGCVAIGDRCFGHASASFLPLEERVSNLTQYDGRGGQTCSPPENNCAPATLFRGRSP